MTATRFDAYATKDEMVAAYRTSLLLEGVSDVAAPVMARTAPVYVPHKYRGGWVIRGFGFSVERINVYVPADRAGCPEAV